MERVGAICSVAYLLSSSGSTKQKYTEGKEKYLKWDKIVFNPVGSKSGGFNVCSDICLVEKRHCTRHSGPIITQQQPHRNMTQTTTGAATSWNILYLRILCRYMRTIIIKLSNKIPHSLRERLHCAEKESHRRRTRTVTSLHITTLQR